MSSHSLAAGSPLSAEYQELLGGYSGVAMPCDPSQALMLLVGESGDGKSTLLRSCPDAFIINADVSSSSEVPRARVWPGVRRDGTPISMNPKFPNDPEKGIPIGGLSWKKILEKKDILIEMARKDVPGRPSLVGLDTVDIAYKMVQQYMIEERNAELAAQGNPPIKDFGDLFGKSAWPESYRHIIDFAFDLRSAGYGVALVFHLGDKTYYEGDSKKKLTKEVLVPENLWHGLYKHAEVVACVEKRIETYNTQVPMTKPDGSPVLLPNGQPRMINKGVTSTQYYMTFESPSLHNKTKKRADLPSSIVLPKEDPWGAWQKAFTATLPA